MGREKQAAGGSGFGEAKLGGGGQLVLTGETTGIGSGAVQQQGPIAFTPNAGDGDAFDFFWCKPGKRLGFAARGCGAERADGAGEAERVLPGANRGSQLHHGLVMVPGCAGGEQSVGQRPERLRRRCAVAILGGIGGQPREDPHHIAVDAGSRGAERNTGDRGGGVGPDAGQLLPLGRGARRGGQGGDRLGEPVQVSGARVIAEAFPEFEHLGFRSGGQCGEVRQRIMPTGEVGKDGFNLRLLKHELADHRAVK